MVPGNGTCQSRFHQRRFSDRSRRYFVGLSPPFAAVLLLAVRRPIQLPIEGARRCAVMFTSVRPYRARGQGGRIDQGVSVGGRRAGKIPVRKRQRRGWRGRSVCNLWNGVPFPMLAIGDCALSEAFLALRIAPKTIDGMWV